MVLRFHEVKKMGWITSHRSHHTGIGKTFEDAVGVVENNRDEPDLYGFEIKAHREESSSYITLCTKAPTFPYRANFFLLNQFGTPYASSSLKRLHTSLFTNRFNTYENRFAFRLCNDRKSQEVRIEIYDLRSKRLLDDSCGYTYEVLEQIFSKKLKNLFYVRAQSKFIGDRECFYYTSADLYIQPSFEKFLKLLDQGKIMYDIRIGSYKSGAHIGRPHDHGSGFRILPSDLPKLYAIHEKID